MSRHIPIVPEGFDSIYEHWHLAPAVRVGDVIHCSGVLGTRPDGSAPADYAEEVGLAFDALAHLLAAAGAQLSDVAELLTFHLDLQAETPTFMKVRDQRLAAPWPAWTAIGAAQLGGGVPGVRLEMKATAYLPSAD